MDRETFLEHLSKAVRRSAAWRLRQAAKFPADRRNGLAAAALEELAQATPADISPNMWLDLQRFIEPGGCHGSPHWHDVVAESCREVGFKTKPCGLEGFAERRVVAIECRGCAVTAILTLESIQETFGGELYCSDFSSRPSDCFDARQLKGASHR